MRSRVLVAGWSSFEHGEATAGDVASMHTAAGWLCRAGVEHDLAWSPVLAARWGGVELEACEAASYTHLLFVCGPLAGWQVEHLCDRFAHARRVAAGVSVVDPDLAGRFHAVLARDGDGPPSVDLAMLAPVEPAWPLVVRVLANPQPEYGERARHAEAHELIGRALAAAEVVVVDADTRLDPRLPNQRTGAALDGLLAAAAAVVTTRLHGLVLGLRAGTPVVAVDPIAGGAKVTAQARALGWPHVLGADGLTVASVGAALERCLADRPAAARCRASANGRAGAAGAAALAALAL